MKTNYLLVFIMLLITSNIFAQQTTADFTKELDKWKLELLINGEVGPPCSDDYQKWSIDNPNYYYGMQEIQFATADVNADGVNDVLYFFPAVNCVGGNGTGSDFAMLVFSNKGILLTNKTIGLKIEEKIKSALIEENIYEIYNVVISFTSMNKTIGGKYFAWLTDDAHCCPGYSGTFEYNPNDFSIKIKNKKESY